jgi:ATP-dependent Clp protease ATP-binding subunit ClpA
MVSFPIWKINYQQSRFDEMMSNIFLLIFFFKKKRQSDDESPESLIHERVTSNDIARVISQITGIPVRVSLEGIS